MASSFDEVSHEDNVYREVMALYAAIKDTPGVIRVRRAEMRQGEVQAEPIDFIIDVELKAKRALQRVPVGIKAWFFVLDNPDRYAGLPVGVREELGKEFNASRLGVDGAYRMLYFRVKNNHQKVSQEETSGIFE